MKKYITDNINIKKNSFIPIMYNIKKIHFVGIGGVGMCGIAAILANSGYYITGSDLEKSNFFITNLFDIGIKVFFRHHEDNIKDTDLIVISSAISKNNPEIIAAYKKKIPVIHRSKMLAEIMRFFYGIAISGTHGKTTTTSMITSIYQENGLDPTFINGGLLRTTKKNFYLGSSQYFITEADESDASFLELKPIISVITNINNDHMSTYKENFKNLENYFLKFLHNLPFYGYAILCLDDIHICNILKKVKRNIITYGFNKNSDICITNYQQYKNTGSFNLIRKNKPILTINLNIPGYHNALNATAAFATSQVEGINEKIAINALRKFEGTKRRFELLGKFYIQPLNGKKGTILLVDDYGHHPTEIKYTIDTIRKGWPQKKIIMIFQPHRYTRTRDLFSEFVETLSTVDTLLMLNIYSAGEKPIKDINSLALINDIYKKKKRSFLIKNNEFLLKKLTSIVTGNSVILIQGAGNISNIVKKIVYRYFKKV
ncbi:UDP-N-acetylmuramate--L-alanine ligase [Candidatus Tachikawaea gelatinosa]|uniref:UDP-N-acetylmuramate--L-alanine ligase n=1 Tax=Candidatus Tachikawaea gelatinosa TaxID=1410383 RepID=A0A090ALE7_9ENTR|nr:UDP-N-acetylmuramate--L-alanine ligase [Candidatus Tachikawaea gelatinosa]BAP58459.1 UDP-N-acetylmuramate--L-alanine ligase [Candidatus Tachikawaea gelatinosa]